MRTNTETTTSATEIGDTAGGDWRAVDEGWGRLAVDFATMSEPGNSREYVAMHQRLRIEPGELVLDVACGSGLALELADARGARCAGIDASHRLIEIARDRVPQADVRVGDMHHLPWATETFDAVTSFRGVWGTTPAAVDEIHRVLTPGGRIGITVWGHIKASPGAWALAPFRLAAPAQVANQAAMVALGRPGSGEALLSRAGFVDIERVTIPFVWEFADPASYARSLLSTGPAFEAVQTAGEEEFVRYATALATERVREGLPLRAVLDVVGYVARRRGRRERVRRNEGHVVPDGAPTGFLAAPAVGDTVRELFAHDVEQLGYVMNASRLWANMPDAHDDLFDLLNDAAQVAALSFRQRAVLVSACASTLGDSYCSLAWGGRLAGVAGDDVASSVLRGDDDGLDAAELELARWARRVTSDPNGTRAADVEPLRDCGYRDDQIFAITLYVALRIAFSTVNDALGARPDHELAESTSMAVRAAITYGRPARAAHEPALRS